MDVAITNTLLGMGTVFTVLILIMLVIYAFRLIPYMSDKLRKGKAVDSNAKLDLKEEIEPIEETDDLLLVAIISAAIAAYEGTTSAEGLVVRSIKKSRRRV